MGRRPKIFFGQRFYLKIKQKYDILNIRIDVHFSFGVAYLYGKNKTSCTMFSEQTAHIYCYQIN